MSDERATDILNELKTRETCGTSVIERIGRRAWERPRVSVSPRLYRQYRVPDPWDPDAPKSDSDMGLGPVGLRLGKKRQPAPHLTPKPPKAKAKSIAEKAREAALAAPRSPKTPAKPKPAEKSTPTPKPEAKVEQSDNAEALTPEEQLAAEAAARRKAVEAVRPRRMTVRERDREGEGGPALLGSLPVRPDIDEITDEVPNPDRSVGGTRRQKGNGGRFRMQSRRIVDAPVVKSVAAPDAPEPAKPVRSAVPDRRAPPMAASGGMDDLFAAAAQQGRMAFVKPPQEPEEE